MNTIQIKSPKGGIVDLKVNQQGKSVGYHYTPSNAYLEAHRIPSNEERQDSIRNKVLGSIKHNKIKSAYPVVAEAVVKMLDKVQVSHLGDTFNSDGSINKQRKIF